MLQLRTQRFPVQTLAHRDRSAGFINRETLSLFAVFRVQQLLADELECRLSRD